MARFGSLRRSKRRARGVEACDDGNLLDEDASPKRLRSAGCGDGSALLWEACDDGNQVQTRTPAPMAAPLPAAGTRSFKRAKKPATTATGSTKTAARTLAAPTSAGTPF